MLVPSIILAHLSLRKLSSTAILAVSLLFVTKTTPAKDAAPVKIPLEPLGFQLPQTQFLLAGSTMMTVDFIDERHLLLTYSAKRLLKRLPECPPGDQDREIDAIIVEVPSGKAMAHTSWRVHDRGQYLWNLGHGRFLLRNRDSLATIAPLVNHARGDAFHERPLIETKRRIGAILLSPDADLLILETLEPRQAAGLEEATTAAAADDEVERRRRENPVQINFFTLAHKGGDEVELTPGEATRSRVPGRIPANAAGYISVLDQGKQRWAFDFNTYDGRKLELSPFDSTCRPSPVLVSRGEFIAFGCHLSHTPQVIAGFNMRGEEMWEQNMTETYMAPTFSYAPAAGRFAFSRMLTHTSLVTDDLISPELVAGQNITVLQADSGRPLLRVDATPVARAGQNYALAPDGLSLAVIRTNAIEIYPLPALTGRERESVQRAEAGAPRIVDKAGVRSTPSTLTVAPEDGGTMAGAVSRASQNPAAPDAVIPASEPPPAQHTPAPTADSVQSPAADAAPRTPAGKPLESESQGDEQPRKPPTLYNEPGEQPAAHGRPQR